MKKFTNCFFPILQTDPHTVDQFAKKQEVEQSLDNQFLSVREDVESL